MVPGALRTHSSKFGNHAWHKRIVTESSCSLSLPCNSEVFTYYWHTVYNMDLFVDCTQGFLGHQILSDSLSLPHPNLDEWYCHQPKNLRTLPLKCSNMAAFPLSPWKLPLLPTTYLLFIAVITNVQACHLPLWFCQVQWTCSYDQGNLPPCVIFVLPYFGLLRLRIAADASHCPLGFEWSPCLLWL